MSRKAFLFWLTFVPNALLMFVALSLAMRVWYPEGLAGEVYARHVQVFGVIFLLWLLVYYIHGLFEQGSLRRYTNLFFNVLSATLVNILLAVVYFYFQPVFSLTPRRFLLVVAGFTFVLSLAWHILIKLYMQQRMRQGLYLLSAGVEFDELEKEITKHSYLGFVVLGKVKAEMLASESFTRDAALVVPDQLHEKPAILRSLYDLRTFGLMFYSFRDLYEQLFRKVYLANLNEAWFLENIDYRSHRVYAIVKRLVDFLTGVVTGVVFLITYPICAFIIKLTSKGPVLFVQERVGEGGKIFKVYKYRTMSGGPTNTWTAVNDPRITTVGKFFRKSRLDELPQCINLLIGNMSLVGPRPEQPHIVEQLKQQIPFYAERHLVKPGLTGWAQLNIYAGSLEESKLKLQYDLYYVKHRGILFDLEIILKTLYYIFTWQGR